MRQLVFGLFGLFLANGIWAESSPVKIALNNWSSQLVLSHIYGQLLSQQGVEVEYVQTKVDEQWGALGHGVLHVQVEVWEGTMQAPFDRLVGSKRILDMGTYKATTREEWWYPKYVEAHCPGLPNWQALKTCAHVFAQQKGGPGVYISGPWEKPDKARVRALGLNFDVRVVPAGDDLWVELDKAFKQKRPVVLFNWSPNWVESQYQGAFVEFPDYHPDCETDPSWGVNPKYLYDCGNPKGGWLKKAAWTGLKSVSPCAFTVLKNLQLNNQQISDMAALIDVNQLSYFQAAQQWIKQNSSTWQAWVGECQ